MSVVLGLTCDEEAAGHNDQTAAVGGQVPSSDASSTPEDPSPDEVKKPCILCVFLHNVTTLLLYSSFIPVVYCKFA